MEGRGAPATTQPHLPVGGDDRGGPTPPEMSLRRLPGERVEDFDVNGGKRQDVCGPTFP